MASPIQAVQHIAAATASSFSGAAVSKPGATAGSAPFSDLLTDAMSQVSGLEDQANSAISGLMTGSGVDVHTAMIDSEKASMAFEMALAVRNKAVQAYQQVMSMQF